MKFHAASSLIFYLVWTVVHSYNQRDWLYLLQSTTGSENGPVLVAIWRDGDICMGCEILTDKNIVDDVISASDSSKISNLSEDDMKILLDDCSQFNSSEVDMETTTIINSYSTEAPRRRRGINPVSEDARRTTTGRTSTEPTRRRRDSDVGTTTVGNNLETTTMATSSSTVEGYHGIPIILPSTKWCGAGDIAKSENDLGSSEATDKCCRDHDHCNDTLAPGETRENLTNDSPFTLLNCRCDEELYDCLDSSDSIVSNAVGNLYFNILGRKCFKKDYPLKCKKYYTIFKITCKEYESDTSQKQSYNWYPEKKYRKIFTK